jgi:hypothetical protein
MQELQIPSFIKRETEVSKQVGKKTTHTQHDLELLSDFPGILLVTGGSQWISRILCHDRKVYPVSGPCTLQPHLSVPVRNTAAFNASSRK